jgi:trimeric autotransporter adhesin
MHLKTTMTVVVLAMFAASACLRPPDDGKPDAGNGSAGGTAVTATLELTPATMTIPLGSTATVRVTHIQPDGTPQDVTMTAELRAEPEGVVIISQGTVRAVAAGAVTLVAKLDQLVARASVVVPQASVRSIEVSVTEPTVAKSSLFTAAAVATLTDGSLLDVSSTAQWSVDNPQDVAEVLSLVGPGLVLARNGGTARVRATVGALTGFAEVIVRDVRVTSLMVTPGMALVPVKSSLQLAAVARYSDGTDVDVTRAVQWTSSTPAFTIDATGLALAKSSGAATFTATLDGQTATATLTATEATATRLTFMPGSLNLAVRAFAPFRVVAAFSDGSSGDVTAQTLFSSSLPAVASVSTSGIRGVVSGLSAGSAEITARFGSVSVTAPVSVTAAALQTVELTPRMVTLSGSGVVSLRARGTYSDGSQSDVTEQAIWSSDDSSIALVSNVAGSRGQVRGLNGGTTVVSAVLNGVRARADITVQAATLTAIELAPPAVSVEAGRTTQLRVIGRLSDNTTRDVTTQATWTSLAPMVATVSNASGSKGLVRAVADGMATIQVTVQGQTATASVRVQPPALTQLSISPATLSVPLNLPVGFSATAAYSDGTALPVTDQVAWSSSNPAVGEVRVEQGYAYLDSKQAGTTVITATMAGVAPAQATVTVTAATLSRIDVTPAQPMLPVGAYVELNASGIYSDLTTQYLRYAVSWTSSDPSVAAVGNLYREKGFVTALRAGVTTITATYNGVSSSTLLTVTSATLTQIQVTPFAPRLPIGFDTNLRATGLYSDNSTRDLTYAVSWTSSAPSTASVGLYADLQPIQAGTATVTATSGTVQGTTLVTVTSATLSSLVLGTPSSMPLTVQATRQLSARGTFSDGSMMDVTPYVTWLSSAPAIASVSNAYPSNGEVKGLSAGSATITAVRGSVTVVAPIQVQ